MRRSAHDEMVCGASQSKGHPHTTSPPHVITTLGACTPPSPFLTSTHETDQVGYLQYGLEVVADGSCLGGWMGLGELQVLVGTGQRLAHIGQHTRTGTQQARALACRKKGKRAEEG